MNKPRTGYHLRPLVGQWIRYRIDHDESLRNLAFFGNGRSVTWEQLRSILTQLAADADHSSLLGRMLDGEAPLPEDEYRKAKAENRV